MRGSVYAMSTIYRALWPDGRGGGGLYMLCPLYTGLWCLMRGLYMPCPLYTGLWGLMRGFVYAMSTIYRAVGSDEGVCICYVHYIQGCGV